jgi:NAD+ synthetase
MKIALAQLNPTVGDIAANTSSIESAIHEGRGLGADLVVLPELSIVGYPPKDLLLKKSFVQSNVEAVQYIASRCEGVAALVGYVEPNQRPDGRLLHNAAAYCVNGRVAATRYKSLLPTYDVFDEHRYFEPGGTVDPLELQGLEIGLSICEDLWNDPDMIGRKLYHRDPLGELSEGGAKLFINMAASPFCLDRPRFREELFASRVRRYGLPLLFCNQVGGNDELIFDGGSLAMAADGSIIGQAKPFEEDILLVDLVQTDKNRCEPRADGTPSVYTALVLGVRDYACKCGFSRAVVGLSGGIDSAVTCAIASAALGPRNVVGIAMPSRHSSNHSLDDARALAEGLGIGFYTVPIEDAHRGMERTMEGLFSGTEPGVAEENIQARIRGNILMSYSNKFGALLLSTGNKSELATGYCTLYGDMSGGLAVISDTPKMMVYDVARHINERAGRPIIPENTLSKPPSAELKPDQTDQDTLPDYEILDGILKRYVEQEQSAEEIVEAGYDADIVRDTIRRVDRNEYKRKQAAPGLRVTSRAFGFGRRMPIAARQTALPKELDAPTSSQAT